MHGAHCWRWSDQDDPSNSINPFLAPYSAGDRRGGRLARRRVAAQLPELLGPGVVRRRPGGDHDRRLRRPGIALYEQINLAIAENVPIWFSGHTATMIGTESNVSGLNGWHLPSGDLGVGFPAAEGRWLEVFLTG